MSKLAHAGGFQDSVCVLVTNGHLVPNPESQWEDVTKVCGYREG